MIGPRSAKYRKVHGPIIKNRLHETKYVTPIFGIYGLKAKEGGILSERELESARRTLKKILKKSVKLWLCVFPDRSISSKPTEVRMGKGKGLHDYWGCVVKEGRILFEIGGENLEDKNIMIACKQASEKLSIKTVVVKICE